MATTPGSSADLRRRTALVVLVVATLIATVWAIWPDGRTKDPAAAVAEPPKAQVVLPGARLHPTVCGNPASKPFVPRKITIAGVADHADVLALPRDAENVPEAPALSDVGKTQFAWDAPTIKPGEPRGNALFNAHTWPDGSAMGNRLLDHLQVGDRIIVDGAYAQLCYKVTKRTVIVASDGSFDYYDQKGPPQLALIVCSPPRLGPGNWKHRTIWYASPIYPAGTTA